MQVRRLTSIVVLLSALVVPSLAIPAAAASPAPITHAVPPTAPTPTDSGNSPDAPDPHPPRGGIGPTGQAVGGSALLSRGLVLPKGSPRLPTDLTAQAWVVADLDTGAIVAARDPHGRYQPASIQKILTAVTLLPLLPGSRRVIVSARAANTEGSHAGLAAGGSYTLDQIFEGLLLVSGNDAAEALAQAAGGRAQTVALMNRTALALGAYDTFVQTPSGLDGWQQLTSAYDMMLFLRAALTQPRFVAYDRVHTMVLPKQPHVGAVRLDNQNVDFLDTVHGAIAAKTGYTDAAQHTFLGAIERDGHRYGVIFLRAQRYPDDQYVQAAKLVAWAAALPAGTAAVGRLEAPSHESATVASRAAAAASGSPTPVSSSAPSTGGSGRGSSNPVAKILVAVLLFGGLYVLMQRLRGPRGPRSPRRPRGPTPPRRPRS